MDFVTNDMIKNKLTNYRNLLQTELNALKKQKVRGKNTKKVINLLQKEYDEICLILSFL